jgi:hypothetical protein
MIHLNPEDPDTYSMDYVFCTYCQARSLVLIASDVCPFCGFDGSLQWVDDALRGELEPTEEEGLALNLNGGAFRIQSNVNSFRNRYEGIELPWAITTDSDSASP